MAKYLRDVVDEVYNRGAVKSIPDPRDGNKSIQVSMKKEEIENVLRVAFDSMGDMLSDYEKLYIIGFMNFEPRDYDEKKSKNPQTGEEMIIQPYRTVSSKPSEAFKKKLSEGHERDHQEG